jgi:ParB family transcriptional regulator, chromosome partitioning protein
MQKKPQLCELGVDQLQRGRYQPRRDFDQTALSELADSIRSSGVIQPIVVRGCGDHRYEIIAGERRWRAAQMAGLNSVPCLVNDYSDEQAAAVTTIENIQRKDLNPIEEARSLQQLIDDFHYLHDEVAAVVGKSRSQITNSLRLLRLEEAVQRWLIEGKLSEGHGKILAGLNPQDQIEIAQRCIAQSWSVRQTEQQVKKLAAQTAITTGQQADIKRLERTLSDQFGAQVKVEAHSSLQSGWLSIQFHNNDTLAGLLEKMGVKYDRPDE